MGQRSTTRTSQNTSSNATSTPNVPSWLQGGAQSYMSNIANLLNSNPSGVLIGPNANQTSAFQGGQQLGVNNQGVADAMGGTRGLMGYTPANVTAGQLASTDMSAYMNPYTDQVINRSLADLERSRQGAISAGQGAATAAGAYGGSRHGVADSLTNREYMDSAGNLAAGLRQAGWNTGLGAAQFDIGNRLGADQFNVNSGMAGANFRLGAANQLGALGLSNDANNRQNLAAQAALGSEERDMALANDPTQARLNYLAQLSQLLGFDPSDYIGQTVNQTGTARGTSRSSSSGLSFGWSPSGGFSFGFG